MLLPIKIGKQLIKEIKELSKIKRKKLNIAVNFPITMSYTWESDQSLSIDATDYYPNEILVKFNSNLNREINKFIKNNKEIQRLNERIVKCCQNINELEKSYNCILALTVDGEMECICNKTKKIRVFK